MVKNWKTTLAGMVAAGVYAWATSAAKDPKQLLVAVAIAVFGAVCKDFNASGTPAQ